MGKSDGGGGGDDDDDDRNGSEDDDGEKDEATASISTRAGATRGYVGGILGNDAAVQRRWMSSKTMVDELGWRVISWRQVRRSGDSVSGGTAQWLLRFEIGSIRT